MEREEEEEAAAAAVDVTSVTETETTIIAVNTVTDTTEAAEDWVVVDGAVEVEMEEETMHQEDAVCPAPPFILFTVVVAT